MHQDKRLISSPSAICISVNPALDMRVGVSKLQTGKVNRAESTDALPGGKAAHVAMALKALGNHPLWLGFLGGATGDYCEERLRNVGIDVTSVRTSAPTRVNLEIIDRWGEVTEILAPGEGPTPAEHTIMLQTLIQLLDSNCRGASVAISGSLPAGLATDFYAELVRLARGRGSTVFLDSSGDALSAALSAAPEFVKINHQEAEQFSAHTISDFESATFAAKLLLKSGAENAVVTMGADGVVWTSRNEETVLVGRGPQLHPASTVGCGDATMAGFIYGVAQGFDREEVMKLAIACGAANCSAPNPGMISASVVEELRSQIQIEQRL